MNNPRIYLLDERALPIMRARLARSKEPTPLELASAREAAMDRARQQTGGAIGVIEIFGLIERRQTMLGYLLNGTDTETIETQLKMFLAASAVSQILLRFDTPGGEFAGTPELSDMIYEARKVKPIVSSIDPLAASAGVWLATSASKAYITPSGQTGSIGVIATHLDYSRQLEADGVTATIVRRPAQKAEGNELEPLTPDAEAYMQASIDRAYGDFVKAMARNRGVTVQDVVKLYGGGRVLDSGPAFAAGLVDGILPWDGVLKAVGQSIATGRATTRALREEHRKRVAETERMERQAKERGFAAYLRKAARNEFDE